MNLDLHLVERHVPHGNQNAIIRLLTPTFHRSLTPIQNIFSLRTKTVSILIRQQSFIGARPTKGHKSPTICTDCGVTYHRRGGPRFYPLVDSSLVSHGGAAFVPPACAIIDSETWLIARLRRLTTDRTVVPVSGQHSKEVSGHATYRKHAARAQKNATSLREE